MRWSRWTRFWRWLTRRNRTPWVDVTDMVRARDPDAGPGELRLTLDNHDRRFDSS